MNIQHSSRSDQWYTPLEVLVAVKSVLGSIDVDPASDEFGNARVGAKYYITQEQNGLASPWPSGTVFCNPPGGKTKNRSNTQLFWSKLMQHSQDRNFSHAIFLAFSLEAMQSTQGKGVPSLLEFPVCVPAKRLQFDKPGEIKEAPAHSNVIVYVPGMVDETDRFIQVFSQFGVCKR